MIAIVLYLLSLVHLLYMVRGHVYLELNASMIEYTLTYSMEYKFFGLLH